jgi:hypothetical protein
MICHLSSTGFGRDGAPKRNRLERKYGRKQGKKEQQIETIRLIVVRAASALT